MMKTETQNIDTELLSEIRDTFQIREVCERLTDGSHVWDVSIEDTLRIHCASQRQAETCAEEIAAAILKATR